MCLYANVEYYLPESRTEFPVQNKPAVEFYVVSKQPSSANDQVKHDQCIRIRADQSGAGSPFGRGDT